MTTPAMTRRPARLKEHEINAAKAGTLTCIIRPIGSKMPEWTYNGPRELWKYEDCTFTEEDPSPLIARSPRAIGERTWVSEAYQITEAGYMEDGKTPYCIVMFKDGSTRKCPTWFKYPNPGEWYGANGCPHWASRFDLTYTGCRAYRLQSALTVDIVNSGIPRPPFEPGSPELEKAYRNAFRALWTQGWASTGAHGKRPLWDFNPWVWAYDVQTEAVNERPKREYANQSHKNRFLPPLLPLKQAQEKL